jgi:hypothetical protein
MPRRLPWVHPRWVVIDNAIGSRRWRWPAATWRHRFLATIKHVTDELMCKTATRNINMWTCTPHCCLDMAMLAHVLCFVSCFFFFRVGRICAACQVEDMAHRLQSVVRARTAHSWTFCTPAQQFSAVCAVQCGAVQCVHFSDTSSASQPSALSWALQARHLPKNLDCKKRRRSRRAPSRSLGRAPKTAYASGVVSVHTGAQYADPRAVRDTSLQ